MIYRDANITDLPRIVEIYNSTIASRLVTADTSPVAVADKVDWFNAHQPQTRPLWVVESEGGIIGWVSYNSFYGRPAYAGTAELSIYLAPEARGKGLGKEILAYSISRAGALQIHSILGFIFSHNKPSIKLFEQAGFKEWGLLKDIAVMDDKRYSLSIYGLSL
ncbi:MAG: N-acetyltransferase family protein [Chitinophagaceae bacterium]|nr:MAG: N-acetyltransferase family protein [Chitinophagaceae bacterium]